MKISRFSLRTFLVVVMLAGALIAPLRYWWLNRKVETVVYFQTMSVKAIDTTLKMMTEMETMSPVNGDLFQRKWDRMVQPEATSFPVSRGKVL